MLPVPRPSHRIASRQTHRSWATAFLLAIVISLCGPARGEENLEIELNVDLDWASHSYGLQLEDGRLQGPGAAWIEAAAANCDFVLFGEQHGVAGLPDVVAATYRLLQPAGFEHLVTERGPWISQRLSQDGVDATLRTYPHAVAFDYDGEARLLRTVESQFDGHGDAFWGVDQSLTAIHGLHRLSQILPTYRARQAARGLYLKDALQGGRFLSRDNAADLQVLRELAGQPLKEESRLILDALQKSQTIFVAYHQQQRDPNGIGISDIEREHYMIAQFDRFLAESASLSHPRPRGIVKMGGAHIMEGIGPNGVPTLGNHIQQLAESDGRDALHIAIHSWNEDSTYPAKLFGDKSMVLIATSELRGALPDTSRDEALARQIRSINQYDAILLLKDAAADTSSEIKGYEQDFKRQLLLSVALVAVPLLAILTLLIPFARYPWQRHHHPTFLAPLTPWLILTGLAAVTITLIVVQILRIRRFDTPAVAQLGTSPLPLLLECGGLLLPSVLCGLMWRRGWWSRPQRAHFTVVAAAVMCLAQFTHWWNLGRMLG